MSLINAQNFPREARYRKLVKPRNSGEVILEADLSQAEARVVAWRANETLLIDRYLAGESVHEFVGSIIIGRPITKKENPTEYNLSKMIVHGTNYMMGPGVCSDLIVKELGVAIPMGEVRKRQNVYLQNFPRIRSGFHKWIEESLMRNNRVISNPFGWHRKFYAPWGNHLFKEACAFYPQSIVALITNQALIRIYNLFGAEPILMQNHDSLVLSVPEKDLEGYAIQLEHAMTHSFKIEGRELTIPVDLKYGKNWGEMNDYHLETAKKLA